MKAMDKNPAKEGNDDYKYNINKRVTVVKPRATKYKGKGR
jgi:hypothetical protein